MSGNGGRSVCDEVSRSKCSAESETRFLRRNRVSELIHRTCTSLLYTSRSLAIASLSFAVTKYTFVHTTILSKRTIAQW